MEGLIDNAKSFLSSDKAKEYAQQLNLDNSNQPTGDPQLDTNSPEKPKNSADASGNLGQEGQFGEEGQYGAVRGKGFGGALAKGPDGGKYDGYQPDDTTGEGGWGGNAFARENQMAADQRRDSAVEEGYGDQEPAGYKTGTSTPGYRQEGDVDAEAAENRIRNQNLNTYGQQSDDRGSKDNDYNEAI